MDYFRSPSVDQKFSLLDVVMTINGYIAQIPERQYSIFVGTDSHRYLDKIIFVTAIVVQRHGLGGRYFWVENAIQAKIVPTLRNQIYQETLYSINIAQQMLELFKSWPLANIGLEIHVDIGQRGETRDLIKEVIGMVKGNGFQAKMKPESFVASTIADRHT